VIDYIVMAVYYISINCLNLFALLVCNQVPGTYIKMSSLRRHCKRKTDE